MEADLSDVDSALQASAATVLKAKEAAELRPSAAVASALANYESSLKQERAGLAGRKRKLEKVDKLRGKIAAIKAGERLEDESDASGSDWYNSESESEEAEPVFVIAIAIGAGTGVGAGAEGGAASSSPSAKGGWTVRRRQVDW